MLPLEASAATPADLSAIVIFDAALWFGLAASAGAACCGTCHAVPLEAFAGEPSRRSMTLQVIS